MSNPYDKVDNSQAVNLNTMSVPQLFDLLERTVMSNDHIKSTVQMFGDRVSPLYMKKAFVPNTGQFMSLTEQDMQTYGNEQPEGTNPIFAKYGIGRTLAFTFTDYGNAFQSTARARLTMKHADVVAKWADLPRLLIERRYLDGVHRLTFGTSASYTNMDGTIKDNRCIDGLSPFNASHTLPFSSDTYTNIVPSNPVFSKNALLAAELLFKTEIKDGFGVQQNIEPNTLISTNDPTLVYNIRQIMGSTTEVGQANSAVINTLTRYRHVILPRLDSDANGAYDSAKKDMWILGRFGGTDGVRMFFTQPVGIRYRKTDVNNLNGDITIAVEGSWEFRVADPRGMVMSSGVGS